MLSISPSRYQSKTTVCSPAKLNLSAFTSARELHFRGYSEIEITLAGLLHGRLSKNRDNACAVERRWTTAGESPARELGSLHPEAIGAAVEETKPSEPLV